MPKQEGCLFCRIARGLGFALAGLLALLLLAAGGLALWLSRADLKPIAERAVGEALDRQVTLSGLEVRWGDPLGIELTGLRIANASWGSEADMVQIGRLSALVDPFSLLRGPLHYERLRIADATIVLERDPDGTGNWEFGGGVPAVAVVPKDRTQFPTLIDFAGENGLITYRTRGGNVLRVALDRVAISSPGSMTPARLHAEGAYNDVAARLDAVTASFAAMQDAREPFGAHFTLAGSDTDITFDGTFTEPLDFEGARGELSIEAQTLNDILGAIGSKADAPLPLSVTGALKRDGDLWSLSAAKGQLMQSEFAGDLKLLEGGTGAPDDIAFDLDSSALDLDEVMAALGAGGGTTRLTAVKLHPEGLAEFNLSAILRTQRLTIAGLDLRDVVLQGRLAAGDITLKELRFALGGGTLSAAGTLAGGEDAGRLSLRAQLVQAEAAKIAHLLGAEGSEIRGRVDGAATITLQGATLGDAMPRSQGSAVLVLSEGDVARSLVERASADLRSLFREQEGRVKATCMLAVMTLRDGTGVLSPLRLESDEAIVSGAGKVDLVARRLDLTLETERDSTNFFALDVPIRISGPFTGLTVDPMLDADEARLRSAAGAIEALPADQRRMAGASACLR